MQRQIARKDRFCTTCGVAIVRVGEPPRGRLKSCLRCYRARTRFVTPAQYLAQKAVAKVSRAGRLLRPSYCQTCGKDCKPHGHHFAGYEAENALKVIWLCTRCHAQAHREMRARRAQSEVA